MPPEVLSLEDSLSDEALGIAEPVEAPAEPVEPAPVETAPDVPVVPENPPETPAVPAAFEMPDKFKDKSPEDIARSFMELERKLGERDEQSIAQARAQWEAELAAVHEREQREAEQKQSLQDGFTPPGGEPQTYADLKDLAYDNPEWAMTWAGNVRPDLVPDVLAAIRENGNDVLADSYLLQYNQHQLETATEAATSEIRQYQGEQQRGSAIQAAYDAFTTQYPQYSQYESQMTELLAPHVAKDGAMTKVTHPDQAFALLEWAFEKSVARQALATSAQGAAVVDQIKQKQEAANAAAAAVPNAGAHSGQSVPVEEDEDMLGLTAALKQNQMGIGVKQ